MEELFDFLVAKGVDYHYKCAMGNLLHMCVARNRHGIFEFLLDKQLNVNEINIHGWTPLHKAITTNQPYYVKRLLAVTNIDPTIKDKEGKTAFDYVNEQTNPEIGQLICQYRWDREQQQSFTRKHRRGIHQIESLEPTANKLAAFFNRVKHPSATQHKAVDRSQYQPVASPIETKSMP